MPEAQTSSQSQPDHTGAQATESAGPCCDDFLTCAVDYARQHPETAALWCFGVGFILGWKLKPW